MRATLCGLVRLLALGGPLIALSAPLPNLTLHVATQGNDAWSGRYAGPTGTDGPLRTLAAAQRAARQALAERRSQPGSGGVTVVIHAGVYPLDRPLVFEPADSGTPEHPMVYRSETPGSVTLSAGRRLTPASAATSGEATFAAPSGLDGTFWAGAPQLWVNGRRAVLAREPDQGKDWYAGQAVAVPGEPASAPGHQAFRAPTPALAFVGRLSAADRDRAVVDVMQSWSNGRHRLATEAPAGTLRISPRVRWPFLFFGTSQRFHIENVAAAFDQPGEWIGSNAGVRYLPLADDIRPLDVVLATLDQWVIVRGAGPGGPAVENLQLLGLGFEHTRSLTPGGGWVDTQAAVDIGAGIVVDHARNFELGDCHIRHSGGYGVWLREGVRDSRIRGCTMQDLGAGGVKVGIAAQPPGTRDATGGNTVTANRITRTGQNYPGAVAIWLGQTFDNEVSHNTITDTTYTGISVGWTWGYGAPTSGRNRIMANALLRIGGGTLSDLGAIYTLGQSPGTVIADNLVREVRGYADHGAGAWGIYNDEGSSDLRIENNVVIGTDSGAYHLNYGRNLRVQGNLFALGDKAELRVSRSEPGRTRLAVQDNLLITASAQPFDAFAKAPDVEFAGNIVAGSSSASVPDLAACGTGCKAANARLSVGPGAQQLSLTGVDASLARRWTTVADNAGATQGLVAMAAPDSNLAPNAGARSAARALASPPPATVAAPPAAPAPALRLSLELDTVPEGGRPAGWRYMPANAGDAFHATTDGRATGGRCLQIDDGAGYANRYEPYMFAQLNHRRGVSTASFALRVDDNAEIVHEWRDANTPARIGPSLRISRQGVEVGGKLVAAVSAGDWIQIRVAAALNTGLWQLDVVDAQGRRTRLTDLPPKTAGWNSLQWLGFIANAELRASSCLAALSITNESR